MPAIAAFRALRYAPGTDLQKVTSPPHDVIFGDEIEAFHRRDPHNIAHVILPEEPDRYQRAARTLEQWQKEGVLVRDDEPSLYLYQVEHGPVGHRRTMTGFFCRVALDPTYTEIRRHEKTLKRKKRDRLDLLEATDCNTEPIWMLYRDERGWIDEVLRSNAFEELARFRDEEDHEHRLLRVDRMEGVQEVLAQFDDRHLVIADGHHRYQTSLDHHAATGREEDASILVCLVRDTDPGIRILPTHRLVQDLPFASAEEAVAAAEDWETTPLGVPLDPAALEQETDERTVVVLGRTGDGVRAWRLRLQEGAEVQEGRGTLDALAVTRVHDRLLRDAWGIEEVERHLRFTQRAQRALDEVAEGTCQLAVLLSPESPHAVLDLCEEGHLMPQKATYFVPKLRSGLVLGPLDEPRPGRWSDQVQDPGDMEFRMPRLD